MKTAILCNVRSEKKTDRVELVRDLKQQKCQVYIGGVPGSEIHPYYGKENAKFLPVDASRSNTNPIVELKSIYSCCKQTHDKEIEKVIIYGVKNHSAMVFGTKLGGASKIICVVNGSGNLFRLGGIKGIIVRMMAFPMLRIAYMLSDSVCFQNSDDELLFRKKKLITKKTKVFLTHGSGVNLTQFPHRNLPEENRFLFLSRITASKGLNEYIAAANIVKKRFKDAAFDIVGPIDTTVEKLKVNNLQQAIHDNVVIYHGSTDDVPSWMGKCRFFVYPSYYPEGVPRCVLQALSTGRPIITCNTSGCKETVEDGVNGFLIAPQNAEELADRMIWLIEHPREVCDMGMASRKLAEEKFDVDKINQIIIKHLLE